MSAISIRNLSKTYPVPFRRLRAFFRRPVKDPVEALRDVSFEVETGEIFGLIERRALSRQLFPRSRFSLTDNCGARMLRRLCRKSLISLCNLCVLCDSVVKELFEKQPQRHREHRDCTEKNPIRTFRAKACLGILSASFAMVFKRGDPFGVFLGAGSALFSGVFFPTELLKTYAGPKLGGISLLLPTTYGLDGIRQVLIEGHGLTEVRQPLVVLLGFLVVLLPFSLWVFGRAVRRAKREGSLLQY